MRRHAPSRQSCHAVSLTRRACRVLGRHRSPQQHVPRGVTRDSSQLTGARQAGTAALSGQVPTPTSERAAAGRVTSASDSPR